MAGEVVCETSFATIRVVDVFPETMWGISDGKYLMLFWENVEIARVHLDKLPGRENVCE